MTRLNHITDRFVTLLTQSQSSLYAYILSLVQDGVLAEDLLQETNLTRWHKAGDFDPETHFMAWACRVAYFKVLSDRRRRARDRHVFNDELLDYLAERQAQRIEGLDRRRYALRDCLKRLSVSQRELIQKRYQPDGSVQAMAREQGRTVGVISQTLYRIRCKLIDCIHASLAVEPRP